MAAGVETTTLPFVDLAVVLRPDRRLARVTGSNLDGARLLDLERGDNWHLDPHVPPQAQTGSEVYADDDLDRGHLTRRRDPAWGDAATAAQGRSDRLR